MEQAVLPRLPEVSAVVPYGPKTASVVPRRTALSSILRLGWMPPLPRVATELVRKALNQPKLGARKRGPSCEKSVPVKKHVRKESCAGNRIGNSDTGLAMEGWMPRVPTAV
eukprot:10724427-Heterocapsa_arctica.AAC.1